PARGQCRPRSGCGLGAGVSASTSPAVARRALAADAALLAVTLIWGVTFPVVKAALAAASPLVFNAARMTLAALLLVAVYRPGFARLRREVWIVGALMGLCLAIGYALQTAGLALISPSISAFLTSMNVVLVPLLLALGWRRRLGWPAWAGALLALLGLYFLLAPAAAASGNLLGESLTLACALAFAVQIVLLGEWAPRLGFRDLAVLQIVFAALFTWLGVPALSAWEAPRWHPTPALLGAVAATAVLATALAFTVQSWAQQFTPAAHAAVVFAFEPVFAWLAALWFWHEGLAWLQLLGAALILAAMLATELIKPPVRA
ncbi:MAG: DMT family transporter, partial [Terriglobales bacterium]